MEIKIKVDTDTITGAVIEKIRELFPHSLVELTAGNVDKTQYNLSESDTSGNIAEEPEGSPSETTIRIRKYSPVYKALITLAKELQKSDQSSISVKTSPANYDETGLMLIQPQRSDINLSGLCELMTDYPTLKELRKKAWGKN